MSVREQLFVRTGRSPAEIAELAAELVGGRAELRDGEVWLLVDTGRLVNGASGEFGGPVVTHASEAPFRPADEFEATDAYNVEMRLWLAGGSSVEPDTGRDLQELAAAAVFHALTSTADLAVIHVHGDDNLMRAVLPGAGVHEFAPDTTIYDWDADQWNGYIVVEPPRPGQADG